MGFLHIQAVNACWSSPLSDECMFLPLQFKDAATLKDVHETANTSTEESFAYYTIRHSPADNSAPACQSQEFKF